MADKILMAHVFAGIISLLSGVLVFVLKKGTPYHVRIGKLYNIAMLIVFLTAIYVSIVKQNWFLLLIGLFSYYLVLSGIRFNQLAVKKQANWYDKFRSIFYAVVFGTMVLWGVTCIIKGNYPLGILLMSFGVIGSFLAYSELGYFVFKVKELSPNVCMREHVGRMTGSFIAAFTAFAVNNIHFLPPLVIWLAPTFFGFILIAYYSRRYKKK